MGRQPYVDWIFENYIDILYQPSLSINWTEIKELRGVEHLMMRSWAILVDKRHEWGDALGFLGFNCFRKSVEKTFWNNCKGLFSDQIDNWICEGQCLREGITLAASGETSFIWVFLLGELQPKFVLAVRNLVHSFLKIWNVLFTSFLVNMKR